MSSLEWLFTKGLEIFKFFFSLTLLFIAFIAMIVWGIGQDHGNADMETYGRATMWMCGGMGIMMFASIFKKK
jgi:hypothetical protein